jgi:hypothetical protein
LPIARTDPLDVLNKGGVRMLNVVMGDRAARYCDGVSRRSFLRAGVLGLAGLALPDWLRLKARAADAPAGSASGTAVILIWLDGGPTHMDMYDLKPDAPAEYRGAMKPTRTAVPGVDICDLMPRQAEVMQHLSVVRSLHHTTGDHFAGAHWMLTGYLGSNAARLDPMYPSAGSITARLRGPNRAGLPAYVAVPHASSVGLNPGYNSAAYLGSAYNPFQTGGDPNAPNFSVQNLRLPNGVTVADLDERKKLLKSFDTMRREIDRGGTVSAMDRFEQEAYEMISGPAARQAFNISTEDPRLRDRYGRHPWGQSCLMARRLVEAGVTFVTVHMGGWDHHAAIEPAMKNVLPIYDRGVGALVADLVDRGLYEKVAICVCGEFGRTPRVNKDAGRDHWGESGFCVLGGGGLKGGVVVGSTNDKGERPRERPVGPEDMLATLYAVLGIDTTTVFHDFARRPHPVLGKGEPIAELI